MSFFQLIVLNLTGMDSVGWVGANLRVRLIARCFSLITHHFALLLLTTKNYQPTFCSAIA
jgi:hypothetical protein